MKRQLEGTWNVHLPTVLRETIDNCDFPYRVATLPDDVKKQLEDPLSRYAYGLRVMWKARHLAALLKSLSHLSPYLQFTREFKHFEVPTRNFCQTCALASSRRYSFGWSHGKEKLETGGPGKLISSSTLPDSSEGVGLPSWMPSFWWPRPSLMCPSV
jgi:hypothetical protein